MSGLYAVSWGPQFFETHVDDGTPISLIEAITESRGVGAARLWRINPDGSVTPLLRNIGSADGLREAIRRLRAHRPSPIRRKLP